MSRSAPPLVRFSPAGAATYLPRHDLGNVIGRNDYLDFGLPIFLTSDGFPIATNASPTGNPFLFHGMEWDAETGLFHDGSANPGMVLYGAKTGKSGRAKQSLRYADPNTGRGIASGDGNFGDNNPWSDGRVVRKMIPITVPDISGNDRRVTVNGSGAGSARVGQLRYSAKQGKTGSASGK